MLCFSRAMKQKTCCLLLFLLIILVIVLLFLKFQENAQKDKEHIPEDQGTIEIYFCPTQACEEQLLQRISNATSMIHCAFYDLDLSEVIAALEEKNRQGLDVKVVVDADNAEESQDLSFVKQDTRTAYMHNKFCIFDDKEIMAGSMNPTYTDTTKNNNNILFITSKILAENYEAEFERLWNKEFGYDAETEQTILLFNNKTIENYFCPEDNCEAHIAETLKQANESIFFMQFSFTSDVLGNIILEKSKTVEVAGIFDAAQNSAYSEYETLKHLNVSLEQNEGKLHHKVFVIDNKIVITGSMNPSKNGNEKNDENILIIHDTQIAALFVEEFNRLK